MQPLFPENCLLDLCLCTSKTSYLPSFSFFFERRRRSSYWWTHLPELFLMAPCTFCHFQIFLFKSIRKRLNKFWISRPQKRQWTRKRRKKIHPSQGILGFLLLPPAGPSLYLQKCCFVFSKQMRIPRLAAQDKIAPLLTKWNTFFCRPKKIPKSDKYDKLKTRTCFLSVFSNFSLYEFPDNIQILSCQSKYLFRANFGTTFPLKFRFRAKCVNWRMETTRL